MSRKITILPMRSFIQTSRLPQNINLGHRHKTYKRGNGERHRRKSPIQKGGHRNKEEK